MSTHHLDDLIRLRGCIGAIVTARDDENFEALMAAIDEARDEALLSAMRGTGLALSPQADTAVQPPQGQAAAPQALVQSTKRAEDAPADAGAKNWNSNRILIATVLLIVALAYLNCGITIWSYETAPVTR